MSGVIDEQSFPGPADQFTGPTGYSSDPPEPLRRLWWWPLVVGAVATLLAGIAIGRFTAPDNDKAPASAGPGNAGELVEAGGLLGPIEGANVFSADRHSYAWPGQVLSAPDPTSGEPIAWRWQTCPVPDSAAEGQEPGGELSCSDAPDANERRWDSPATDTMVLVRVIVTVDLGGVRVEAASVPVAAMPWPANVTPGEPPPTTTTTAPPPPPPPPPPPEIPPEFSPPA